MRLRRKRRSPLCPLCKDALDEILDLHTCPGCQTTYHRGCNEELGGCSTLGCSSKGRALSRNAPNRFRVPASRLARIRAQLAAERESRARRREREGVDLNPKRSGFALVLVVLLFTILAMYLVGSGVLERFMESPLGLVAFLALWIASTMSRVSGFFRGD